MYHITKTLNISTNFYCMNVCIRLRFSRVVQRPGQRWNQSGFYRPDPTGKFQNHRRLTGRSTGFLTEGFSSLFNVFDKKILKWGAWVRC